MTEEKADQICRCVKECWWRVGALLTLIIGGGLIASHGWPQGDWAFGWGAIGALGTLLIGGITAYISHTQKEWHSEERNYHRERIESMIVRLGMELYHTSAVGSTPSSDGPDIFEDLMRNLDVELSSLFSLEAEKGVYLLTKGKLSEFRKYCATVSEARGLLGMARLSSVELRNMLSPQHFQTIMNASKALVEAFADDITDLRHLIMLPIK